MLGCAAFSQTVVVPEILALGNGRMEVLILLDCPVHPKAETRTEYVPVVPTVIEELVAELLHK